MFLHTVAIKMTLILWSRPQTIATIGLLLYVKERLCETFFSKMHRFMVILVAHV